MVEMVGGFPPKVHAFPSWGTVFAWKGLSSPGLHFSGALASRSHMIRSQQWKVSPFVKTVGGYAFSTLFSFLQEIWEPPVENGRDADEKSLRP